jgi:ParB-like chromosome segregation protein Spo0J
MVRENSNESIGGMAEEPAPESENLAARDSKHSAAAQQLSVTYRAISQLAPYGRNARTHSKSQIRKIAESIKAFGFTNPILIDSSFTIIAGHGRVQAAKLLDMIEVPTILLESLTKAQIQA